MSPVEPEIYLLAEGAEVPNNPDLPVLIYRKVSLLQGEELAAQFEKIFRSNGWPPAWRYFIYDFAHYHSTAHEVIGVFAGRSLVKLGADKALETWLEAGDVIVIPAGVSHESLQRTTDFCGVGAYPMGQKSDSIRPSVSGKPMAAARIEKLSKPAADPLFGKSGPLQLRWAI